MKKTFEYYSPDGRIIPTKNGKNKSKIKGTTKKVFVSFNQLLWTYHYPKSTINHIIIFEEIKSMCNSNHSKMKRDEEGFTWISSNKILSDNPFLNAGFKCSLTKYIKDLINWNLIKRKKSNKTWRCYYKEGDCVHLLNINNYTEDQIKNIDAALDQRIKKENKRREENHDTWKNNREKIKKEKTQRNG